MKFTDDIQVESRLKLTPNPKTYNVANVIIDAIELKSATPLEIDEKTGKESQYEYKGIEIPRLSVTFRTREVNENGEFAYLTHSWSPIVSIKNDGTPNEDVQKIYVEMYKSLQHLYNAFKDSPNYKERAALPDIDIDGTPKVRANQTAAFFKVFLDSFTIGKDGKTPIYKDGEIDIDCWLKIVANANGTSHDLPRYVEQGWIEAVKRDAKGIAQEPIRAKVTPKDRIELSAKATKGAKAGNISTGVDSEELDSETADLIAKYQKK